MNSFLLIFAFVAITIVIVGLAIWHEKKKNRERRENMQAAAEELGLEFLAQADDSFASRVAGFDLFNKGHSRKILNIVIGQTEDFELTILDYHYTTGSGQHQQRHKRTVALIEAQSLAIPSFTLRPENVFDKLGAVLGMQDIDFSSHPDFSNRYLLKGKDEKRVREFFDDSVLSFLQDKQKLCVEAVPGQIIIYYANRPPSADQLKSLFAEALAFFGVFDARARALPEMKGPHE